MLAIIVMIVPINSNVVTHGKVYPIQHHVIKFVSDLLHSLHANPLAQSLEQIKLDSDK
jgi:hypothetical protein